MAASLPLGHPISLITKSDVRYVGTLYSLDSDKITVTLAKGMHGWIHVVLDPLFVPCASFGAA